ncbi:hypothetical protein DPMN_156304 [Dreissena polymorpha]|uniref:Uncharacterized protein n=1 Tax=Dreissena polymorpha TaxID=45954 RepID=A0A9D4J7G0_DREPO|nr:hypothetical protein DPMN_156304 [Dreissena polymorpha]
MAFYGVHVADEDTASDEFTGTFALSWPENLLECDTNLLDLSDSCIEMFDQPFDEIESETENETTYKAEVDQKQL